MPAASETSATQVRHDDPVTEHADHASEEVASRLRLSINRLHRLLRQESLAGLSPAQASALGAVNRLGSPTLGEPPSNRCSRPP
jgi:hypothetical protein